MSEINWTIDPETIEWKMPWNEEEQVRFKKPPVEDMFEEVGALTLLLNNEVIHLNDHWWEKTWPEECRKLIYFGVRCSDTFAYACAESLELPFDEIENLYRFFIKDPLWGPTAWCVKTKGEAPIPPVMKALRERGYEVDTWNLRDNYSNAETQAAFAAAKANMAKVSPT